MVPIAITDWDAAMHELYDLIRLAHIATVSAFSAVNFHFLPPLVRWLWPSVVGGIGITLWVAYYKRGAKKAAA